MILNRDPELCVVGLTHDGADALIKPGTLEPDVITLDVEMPVLDDYTTLPGTGGSGRCREAVQLDLGGH